MCRADRLEHLDADDIVIGPRGRGLEVAVVGLQHGDSAREPCGPDALLGERALLGTERCGGYGAADLLHGLDGEAAPAGADLEDAVGWLMCALSMKRCSQHLRASSSDSVAERGSDLGSHIGHVCHVWGEEGGEHVVADVVVGVDVELSVFEAVASSGYSREAVAHGGSECGATG